MHEFRILGPFEVVGQQGTLTLGGPKQRALLAILLLRRGELVSGDRLIDLLWGESPPATAAKTLQGYVSHLRRALGDGQLITRGSGYMLVADDAQVDAVRFDRVAADGRQALDAGEVDRARELLGSGLALWRGEPLADLAYEPFAAAEIARLEEARITALEDRIDADLILGHHRLLVGELEGLVAAHPSRERLLGQLMLALYRSGRQTDALEAYHAGRRILRDELGLEPWPQLRALEQRILTHDPSLELPTPRIVIEPTAAVPSHRVLRLIGAGAALALVAAVAFAIVRTTGGAGAKEIRPAPNSVAVINIRDNRVVGQVAVGARPGPLAFGSGFLWVGNLDDQTVSQVDPGTFQQLRALQVSGPPTGIAAASGAVWVVNSSPSSTSVPVNRIDPEFDTITRIRRLGNLVPDSPPSIAAKDGVLWVAPSSGALAELNPLTGLVDRQLDPNDGPTGIAAGEGAVWLTDNEANNVNRVDPTGLVTSLPVGRAPTGIAAGAGGVWVADMLDGVVERIDPDTRAVAATIRVGNLPVGVTVGAGSVWVANSGDGTVSRIDPSADKVVATITVGGSPQAIAVGYGRVWVTDDARTIPPQTGGSAGQTLRLDAQDDITSMALDPAISADPNAAGLLYATCAKLLNYPDKSGPAGSRLVPEVAQSLPALSADGRTYTFTIRKGFEFSPPSNQPVTAQTFKQTIERTLNPKMRNPIANEYADIVGARAYISGKAAHISGVVARGSTLTIRLVAPAPDLPVRLAEPAMCAVPHNTPVDPQGVRAIPMAGPYRIASYAPGQGVVLTRNPNYHGDRPRRFARIVLATGISLQRSTQQVLAGKADYAVEGVSTGDAATLVASVGPGSPAAQRGRQQLFVDPVSQLDFFTLNTHRPLFASTRLRQAVNYAIDRAALARLGDAFIPLSEHVTDLYIPPGIPGYTNTRVYPSAPDLAKARRLARGATGKTVVLYTCDISPCGEQAQIVKTDLAAIGLRVAVRVFQSGVYFTKLGTPGEPFDMAWDGWLPDYPDPDSMLNQLLETNEAIPSFNDPHWRARLAAAARLTGPRRYLTYARLDTELARDAAPWVAFGNLVSRDLFSARIGCESFGVYGVDLAALCIRSKAT